MKKWELVNEIIARDLVMGTLARESLECYEENKNMSALACLFILTEQAIKVSLNKQEGNFAKLINEAKSKGIVSEDEFYLLNDFREIRNKIFHENNYMWHIEVNVIFYPFSENQTKKTIFEKYSEICFRTTLNCLSVQTDSL